MGLEEKVNFIEILKQSLTGCLKVNKISTDFIDILTFIKDVCKILTGI